MGIEKEIPAVREEAKSQEKEEKDTDDEDSDDDDVQVTKVYHCHNLINLVRAHTFINLIIVFCNLL